MDTGILTNLLTTFTSVFGAGYGRVLPYAQHLLSMLITLEVTTAALFWVLNQQKIEVELIRKLLHIGFFVWVVNNFESLCKIVLRGFIYTGEKAGGHSAGSLLTDPSQIIDYGFAATAPIFEHTNDYSTISVHRIVDCFFTELAAILILIAFFALAVLAFISYLEFYIVSVLGLILVPFGVFKHTSFLAEKVFGAVIAFGIRLMVLAFILAVTQPTLASLKLPADPSLKEVFILLLAAATITGLSWHAPSIASSLMAGSPSLGLSAVFGTAAAGAAGVAGAGMAVGAAVHATGNVAMAATRAAASGASHLHQGSGGGSGSSGGGTTVAAATTSSGHSPASASSAHGDDSVMPTWASNLLDKNSSSGKGESSGAGSSQQGRQGGGMPAWAQSAMLAQRAMPPEAHSGPGVAVPLRHD